MKQSQSGSSLPTILGLTAFCGGGALIALPDIIPAPFNILGWVVVAGACIAAIIVFQKQEKIKKQQARETEKKRQKRSAQIKQQKQKQEETVKASRNQLIKKEEKQAQKLNDLKQDMAKQAEIVWGGRINEAKDKENYFKDIVKKSNKMPIRTAAGNAAFEWNEASRIAQWTMQQITMFVKRPSVTTKAREEAREAIVESVRVRETGGNWTKEKGEELANKKLKAKAEVQIEEDRLTTIENEIEKANAKWRAAEIRAARWQNELDQLHGTNKKK